MKMESSPSASPAFSAVRTAKEVTPIHSLESIARRIARPLIVAVVAFVGIASSGCMLEGPHSSQRSPEIRGKITESVTGKPIEGAKIFLHDHPSVFAISDRVGDFKITETRNHHLVTFLGICSSDFPAGKVYGDELDVSHPRYEAIRIKGRDFRIPDSSTQSLLVMSNITLTPSLKP
jgi:hypothetical protein